MTKKVSIKENGREVKVVATPIEVLIRAVDQSGRETMVWLTPTKARKLAKALNKIADMVDAND